MAGRNFFKKNFSLELQTATLNNQARSQKVCASKCYTILILIKNQGGVKALLYSDKCGSGYWSNYEEVVYCYRPGTVALQQRLYK